MNEENELYVVCNILLDDDSIDPQWGGSRQEYFEVQWSGTSLRIPPGETRIVPKYLADHFAKHLVDHILTRRKKMLHDSQLRDPLIAEIILRKANESDRISTRVEQGNGSSQDPIPKPDSGNNESLSDSEESHIPDRTEGTDSRGVVPETTLTSGRNDNPSENNRNRNTKKQNSERASQERS